MLTIAVLGVIATLAAPNLRTFLVRNKVSSLSNEFAAALLQGLPGISQVVWWGLGKSEMSRSAVRTASWLV